MCVMNVWIMIALVNRLTKVSW